MGNVSIADTFADLFQTYSLDRPVHPGQTPNGLESLITYADVLPDPEEPKQEKTIEAAQEAQYVRAAIRRLPRREARIISLRFGIGVKRDYTLREVGTKLGICKERVRQLEARALKTLNSLLTV